MPWSWPWSWFRRPDWWPDWLPPWRFVHSYPPTDDLLFYDRAAGIGRFEQLVSPGNPSFLSEYDDWNKSWTLIIPL
jgi:hypothetical protein